MSWFNTIYEYAYSNKIGTSYKLQYIPGYVDADGTTDLFLNNPDVVNFPFNCFLRDDPPIIKRSYDNNVPLGLEQAITMDVNVNLIPLADDYEELYKSILNGQSLYDATFVYGVSPNITFLGGSYRLPNQWKLYKYNTGTELYELVYWGVQDYNPEFELESEAGAEILKFKITTIDIVTACMRSATTHWLTSYIIDIAQSTTHFKYFWLMYYKSTVVTTDFRLEILRRENSKVQMRYASLLTIYEDINDYLTYFIQNFSRNRTLEFTTENQGKLVIYTVPGTQNYIYVNHNYGRHVFIGQTVQKLSGSIQNLIVNSIDYYDATNFKVTFNANINQTGSHDFYFTKQSAVTPLHFQKWYKKWASRVDGGGYIQTNYDDMNLRGDPVYVDDMYINAQVYSESSGEYINGFTVILKDNFKSIYDYFKQELYAKGLKGLIHFADDKVGFEIMRCMDSWESSSSNNIISDTAKFTFGKNLVVGCESKTNEISDVDIESYIYNNDISSTDSSDTLTLSHIFENSRVLVDTSNTSQLLDDDKYVISNVMPYSNKILWKNYLTFEKIHHTADVMLGTTHTYTTAVYDLQPKPVETHDSLDGEAESTFDDYNWWVTNTKQNEYLREIAYRIANLFKFKTQFSLECEFYMELSDFGNLIAMDWDAIFGDKLPNNSKKLLITSLEFNTLDNKAKVTGWVEGV